MHFKASKALFVGSDVYRESAFGKHRPLSIIRVSGVVDVCEMLGWFDHDQFRESPRASVVQLQEFHQADYIDAIITADRNGSVEKEVREKYRIGTQFSPAFSGGLPRPLAAPYLRLNWRCMKGRFFIPPAARITAGRTGPVVSVISMTPFSQS